MVAMMGHLVIQCIYCMVFMFNFKAQPQFLD